MNSDNVVETLYGAVTDAGDQEFIEFGNRTLTFRDMWQRAAGLAGGLRAAGVAPGETVVSVLDNSEDALSVWFAANMVGAIWVPVNTALRGEFLRHVISDSGARVVFCEADLLTRITEIATGIPEVKLVLVRGRISTEYETGFGIAAIEDYRIEPADEGWHRDSSDALSMLIYTGGTTGPSKGCTVSHGFVHNVTRRYLQCTGRTAAEVDWSPLPMFHLNIVAQTILGSVLLRGRAAVSGKFSLSRFWPEIKRTRAQVVHLLGSMGTLVANMPDVPEMRDCYGQIRYVHGAPFPAHIRELWFQRFGIGGIGGYYGMTEAVPMTLMLHNETTPDGSQGRVNNEDFEMRIIDEDDSEVPPGEVGEVIIRPRRKNVMFQGYWGRPEATVAATRNLWFHTGDLASVDADGFFYFRERKSDAIRRRGENISSTELEVAFMNHPDIAQVAVHAVTSELTEHDVKVTAVLKPGATVTERALFEWSKDRLPYFALPRYIEFRDQLPMSGLNRVLKFELRDQGVTAATWDRDADPAATWERR
jgi:crotonobetaine/carnitine-CoA ligase